MVWLASSEKRKEPAAMAESAEWKEKKTQYAVPGILYPSFSFFSASFYFASLPVIQNA